MATSNNNDTIAAISTPIGEGGIGVVRLSGKRALKISDKLFHSKSGKPSFYKTHTIHYGHIKRPATRELVDEVLLSVMRSPRTYTKEDIVEISCHGGVMCLKKVLEACLNEGARLAEPGEFTKRAFLNGRIDLAQAEAVLDIIKSETDISQRIAIEHLKGSFSEEIRSLRNFIIDILSSIELLIDFSEEDIDFPALEDISQRIKEAHSLIKKILDTSEKGIMLRRGASVVICGRPNVGKSSLMNALLRHDRVIVTPIAGTTRDVIEEYICVAGVKVRLSDTAGIIDTRNRVELEGIKRSREKLRASDIVIFMLDYSQPLSKKDKDIYETIKDKEVIIVANKIDLTRRLIIPESKRFFHSKILKVSALKKKWLEALEDEIAKRLFKGKTALAQGQGPIITNLRHKQALVEAGKAVDRAITVTSSNFNGELLASDLNEAVYWLGFIIGESIEDDVLDRIFSQFCIGK